MSEPRMIKVNKESTGAKKRLYKAIRLWALYEYKSVNHGWFSKKYKARYRKANAGMRSLIIKILHRFGTYQYWYVQAIGSKKFIDLDMDRYLEFLITIGDNKEDM